jgi:hypothetical protein
LMALELHPAILTPVNVNGHFFYSLSEREVIIALFAGSDKTLTRRLYRCLTPCKVASMFLKKHEIVMKSSCLRAKALYN